MAFHLYDLNELYSNATGTIQFIELRVGNSNGESFWQGQTISVTQGNISHLYQFATNLPSTQTANTSVLLATQGFANLGIVQPDFIVPDGFLFIDGGTVNFAGVDAITYAALPTDGTSSLNPDLTTGTNSPTNFAGVTGTVPAQGPTPIVGTDGADTLTGTAGDDTIQGSGGNDLLNGLGGNDLLDGGGGIDTAVFTGNLASYAIGTGGISLSGPDGSDTLTGIERLQFADAALAFDLQAGQSAGDTVRLIGAAFGTVFLTPAIIGLIIDFFDIGVTMPQLCEAALAVLGSPTNAEFVTLIFRNLIERDPSAEELDIVIALLQGSGGPFTQAQLLQAAAYLEINETHIGLAGMQENGVEFV